MNHEITKTALINATSIYYEYLQNHNLGCEQLQILGINIQEAIIKFFIKAKFVNTDSLMLDVCGRYTPLSEEAGFCVLFYDEKTGILAIECLDFALLEKIEKHKSDIKLFSDLKFLIRNLEMFFENAKSFALPTKNPPLAKNPHFATNPHSRLDSTNSTDFPMQSTQIATHYTESKESTDFTKSTTAPNPAQDFAPKDYLNAEQKSALMCALSEPFSYIWGAPGSGKTQVVLFEALLYYIYNGLPVCVLAPTNSALEQVLIALISKFDTLGLNREKILRLGTPSNAFLEKYTEVCDPQVLQKKAKDSLFSSATPRTRLKEALLIGMTMDGFIKKHSSLGIDFCHFFLDECAFTPLIKALALTTQNTPITLLGDHKQLMPICEMPTSQIKGDKIWANLFNLSSLFLEDFFAHSAEVSAPIFSKSQSSPLCFTQSDSAKTAFCILRQTHRYGDNLAKILDSHIYHNGLKGKQENTRIFYIDCPNAIIEDKQNITEARAIAALTKELEKQKAPFLSQNDFSDFAIITPFIKQKKLLSDCGVSYRRIWTIHGSQGQEFDTVIFSPVMLHHHLTDSRNTNACYALNVAISRIKKQLIIVCDRAYWLRFRGQFLSEILANALPFPNHTSPQAYAKTSSQSHLNTPTKHPSKAIEIIKI